MFLEYNIALCVSFNQFYVYTISIIVVTQNHICTKKFVGKVFRVNSVDVITIEQRAKPK